eukprot:20069-Heterococcus_DN1.PRE.3
MHTSEAVEGADNLLSAEQQLAAESKASTRAAALSYVNTNWLPQHREPLVIAFSYCHCYCHYCYSCHLYVYASCSKTVQLSTASLLLVVSQTARRIAALVPPPSVYCIQLHLLVMRGHSGASMRARAYTQLLLLLLHTAAAAAVAAVAMSVYASYWSLS